MALKILKDHAAGVLRSVGDDRPGVITTKFNGDGSTFGWYVTDSPAVDPRNWPSIMQLLDGAVVHDPEGTAKAEPITDDELFDGLQSVCAAADVQARIPLCAQEAAADAIRLGNYEALAAVGTWARDSTRQLVERIDALSALPPCDHALERDPRDDG